MIVREVILRTDRLMDVDRFYRDILGLPVVEEELGRVSFLTGTSRLTFVRVPESHISPFYHYAINIPPDLFEEAKRWLSNRTPLLNDQDGEDEFYFEAMDARAVYFRDPGHNIGELIAREEIGKAGSISFDVGNMVAISEIGLPVRDVRHAGERLQSAFELHDYIPLNDLFGAIGNPEGMFILVREERRWVPTYTPAGIFPMDVILAGTTSATLELDNHPYRFEMRP